MMLKYGGDIELRTTMPCLTTAKSGERRVLMTTSKSLYGLISLMRDNSGFWSSCWYFSLEIILGRGNKTYAVL